MFAELLGVLMAIRDGFVVNTVDIDADSEQVWARVKLPGNKQLHICSFYQSPSSGMNPLCDLKNSIEKITQPGQNLVIAGDFNCGDVDWDSSTVKPDAYDRAPNQKLLDLVNKCSLTNVQQQATRRGRALVEPNNFNLYLSKKTTTFLYQNWVIPLPLLLVTWKLQLRVLKNNYPRSISTKLVGPTRSPIYF